MAGLILLLWWLGDRPWWIAGAKGSPDSQARLMNCEMRQTYKSCGQPRLKKIPRSSPPPPCRHSSRSSSTLWMTATAETFSSVLYQDLLLWRWCLGHSDSAPKGENWWKLEMLFVLTSSWHCRVIKAKCRIIEAWQALQLQRSHWNTLSVWWIASLFEWNYESSMWMTGQVQSLLWCHRVDVKSHSICDSSLTWFLTTSL